MNVLHRGSVRRRRVTWVMSGCAYAREGLAALIGRLPPFRQAVEVFTGLESTEDLAAVSLAVPPSLIVVYLPGAADLECDILRGLAQALRQVSHLPEVVVLCEGEMYWIYLALMRLSGQMAVEDRLRVLDAGQAVASLGRQLHDPDCIPLLRLQLTRDQRQAPPRLSSREMQTLQWTLEGVPMVEQGRRLGVSEKTLYAHRYRAMKKLGGDIHYRSGHWLWHRARLFCDAELAPASMRAGGG
ncbi:helix-turn-helix transcriptional regulator [Trabulsiella odontotermitis]|uniref:helix-turn-helix transcriptional regulator n=1 Tax=Trabulsiella odontotermitis TaxID=379893 RepID=UPI00067673FB|nr:LuxR C-terminal-related transcriptional regulator [Trabulsiella odontotermitis]